MKQIIDRIKHWITASSYDLIYFSGMLAHRTKVDWNSVKHIACDEEEVNLIFGGLSAIYFVDTKDVKGYFRTVLPHLSYKKTVLNAVNEYYTRFFPEQKIECRCVKDALNKCATRRKFFNMGNIDDPYSRARRFRLTKNTKLVGIETPDFLKGGSKEWKSFINNIIELLRYVRITQTRHRRNQWGGDYEYSGVNRQMATEAVAKLLGLDYMIPHSEFVVIKYKNIELKGTLMEIADGESTKRISRERALSVLSPELQKELISLNVLDTITFERDHRPGNYNMVLDEKGKVIRLSVYDNDAAMTFAPFPASMHSGSACSNIIRGGKINRPYIDMDLAERIMSLKKQDLRNAVAPFLNRLQIQMCWQRILAIKKLLLKETGSGLLINGAWSDNTIKKEINGGYGRTYLKLFLDYESISKDFYDYCHVADIQ